MHHNNQLFAGQPTATVAEDKTRIQQLKPEQPRQQYKPGQNEDQENCQLEISF